MALGASGDESKSKSFFFFLIHRVAFLSLCSQTVCFCHLPRHKMRLRNARLCGCALKCNHPKIHFTCSCLRLPGKRARVFSVRCADRSPPAPLAPLKLAVASQLKYLFSLFTALTAGKKRGLNVEPCLSPTYFMTILKQLGEPTRSGCRNK